MSQQQIKAETEAKAGVLIDQLNEAVDYVTKLVDPKKQSDVKLIAWHKTPLTGTKAKIQSKIKKKKTKTKSKTLSRAEFDELGVYNLPTKSMKYTEAKPIHELWTQYIHSQLQQYLTKRPDGRLTVPEVYDNNYDAFSKALAKSDFHGAKINVIASLNPTLVGQTGIVLMETRNTFKLIGTDDRIRTIPKFDSIFKIIINDIELKIYGKYLNIRPAERSVKKIKTLMEPDL